MAHILHIDSSPRGERSFSRKLSYEFITAWKNAHPEDTLTYRDLGKNPVPHVNEGWIAAAFTPLQARTPELDAAIKLSDDLVDEFLAADRYVFGIPMYNFSVPSTFKAYIDQIIRVNRTYATTDQGYEGLVHGKKMLVVTASGGSYRSGTPAEQYDYLKPFLQAVFGLVGITNITFVQADNLSSGDDARQESLDEARTTIEDLVANW